MQRLADQLLLLGRVDRLANHLAGQLDRQVGAGFGQVLHRRDRPRPRCRASARSRSCLAAARPRRRSAPWSPRRRGGPPRASPALPPRRRPASPRARPAAAWLPRAWPRRRRCLPSIRFSRSTSASLIFGQASLRQDRQQQQEHDERVDRQVAADLRRVFQRSRRRCRGPGRACSPCSLLRRARRGGSASRRRLGWASAARPLRQDTSPATHQHSPQQCVAHRFAARVRRRSRERRRSRRRLSRPRILLHADEQREERETFDQGGRDDHRRLDAAGDFGLTGHALQGRAGQLADAVGGADASSGRRRRRPRS